MQTLQADPPQKVKLTLPPIALSDLPEATKDFILARANAGTPPAEVIREILDRAATAAGFEPNPKAA